MNEIASASNASVVDISDLTDEELNDISGGRGLYRRVALDAIYGVIKGGAGSAIPHRPGFGHHLPPSPC